MVETVSAPAACAARQVSPAAAASAPAPDPATILFFPICHHTTESPVLSLGSPGHRRAGPPSSAGTVRIGRVVLAAIAPLANAEVVLVDVAVVVQICLLAERGAVVRDGRS